MSVDQCLESFRKHADEVFGHPRPLYKALGSHVGHKYSDERLTRSTQSVVEVFEPIPYEKKVEGRKSLFAAPGSRCKTYDAHNPWHVRTKYSFSRAGESWHGIYKLGEEIATSFDHTLAVPRLMKGPSGSQRQRVKYGKQCEQPARLHLSSLPSISTGNVKWMAEPRPTIPLTRP